MRVRPILRSGRRFARLSHHDRLKNGRLSHTVPTLIAWVSFVPTIQQKTETSTIPTGCSLRITPRTTIGSECIATLLRMRTVCAVRHNCATGVTTTPVDQAASAAGVLTWVCALAHVSGVMSLICELVIEGNRYRHRADKQRDRYRGADNTPQWCKGWHYGRPPRLLQ